MSDSAPSGCAKVTATKSNSVAARRVRKENNMMLVRVVKDGW